MKAVIWAYGCTIITPIWSQQIVWLVKALQQNGVTVLQHPGLTCQALQGLKQYNSVIDTDIDICVYTHTDSAHLPKEAIDARNWFFKPTVPDEIHTTLDTLGFGPYSSIAYEKPDFENISIGDFFDTKVKAWIETKTNKWGTDLAEEQVLRYRDYNLILGQCGGDTVVTQHEFGAYFSRLEAIVSEVARITKRPLVVKLHPYTGSECNTKSSYKSNEFALRLQTKLQNISECIHVYTGKTNVHNFIENSRCVILANSGAGFDAMMHRKPIIAWGYPEYHWVTYDLRHLADLKNALKLKWFDVAKQDKFLYWYMEKYCYYDQETANSRVKELLEKENNDL
jgi:hypothetical protein